MADQASLEVIRSELAFFTVPPPRSGHVVELLAAIPGVVEAAAVYSGVDVVALLSGTDEQIAAVYEELARQGAPIDLCEPFAVDVDLPGKSASDQIAVVRGACTAYVRCETQTQNQSVDWAASVLSSTPGVRRLLYSRDHAEVVLEVVAENKSALDDLVMNEIQTKWTIKSTRTLMVINELVWSSALSSIGKPIFISMAKTDLAFGTELANRIHKDLGLEAWTFQDIDLGKASWPDEIDVAIRNARLCLFLVSADSLTSDECNREFGKADDRKVPEDVCLVLLPGCEVSTLPVRFQQRQCLKADDFFAYPRLRDWVVSRLRQAG